MIADTLASDAQVLALFAIVALLVVVADTFATRPQPLALFAPRASRAVLADAFSSTRHALTADLPMTTSARSLARHATRALFAVLAEIALAPLVRWRGF